MNKISLRPYQQKFIDDIRKEFRAGFKRVCGVAPCGAGKTIMTGWMIKEAVERGKRAVFFVHRKELIEQTAKTFSRLNIPFGVISSGYDTNYKLPVQIAGVQTLVNRLDFIAAPDLLICDECHHILSNSYKKIIDCWKDSYLLGVTATPERMGGIRLGDIFQALVIGPSVQELINLGNLTKFQYLSPAIDVDFTGLRTHFGDYDNHQLEKVMDDEKIIQGIVDKYLEYAEDKSCICYCVNVNHSKKTADAFNAAGISAAHCDGETPKKIRDHIVKAFRAGAIKVLCNAELFGEGFDVPNMDAVILARPTKSLTLHIQQSMRPLRPDPNNPDKIATIIDYVKNWEALGMPDIRHNWSLKPNAKKEEGEAPCRKCPKCDTVCHISQTVCPCCGYVFPIEIAPVTEDVGKLQSVSKKQFSSIEHFIKIADSKNYKRYWAVLQALKYVETYEEVLHIAEVMHYKKGWAYWQWQKIQERLNHKE